MTSDLKVNERKTRKVIKPTAVYNKWINNSSSSGPNGPCEINVSDTTAFQRPLSKSHRKRLIDSQDLEALEKFHLNDSFSLVSASSTNEPDLRNIQSEWSAPRWVQSENTRSKRRSRD